MEIAIINQLQHYFAEQHRLAYDPDPRMKLQDVQKERVALWQKTMSFFVQLRYNQPSRAGSIWGDETVQYTLEEGHKLIHKYKLPLCCNGYTYEIPKPPEGCYCIVGEWKGPKIPAGSYWWSHGHGNSGYWELEEKETEPYGGTIYAIKA